MDTKMRSWYREYMGGWNLWMKVLEASLLCDHFCFGGWWLSFLYINAFQPRNSLHACPNSKPVIFTLNNSNRASWLAPGPHPMPRWYPIHLRGKFGHITPQLQMGLSSSVYSSTVLFEIYQISSLALVATVLPVRESLTCPMHPSFSHPLGLFSGAEMCTPFVPCGLAVVFVSLTKSQ